jgi:small subunit ribosomal protein S1
MVRGPRTEAALSAENDAMTTAETTEQSKPTEPLAAVPETSGESASPAAASAGAAARSEQSDVPEAAAQGGDAGDEGDDGDDAPEGGAAAGEGAAASPTGEKKKRRRRRKKKGPGAEGAVAGAPGATPGEGGEAGAEAKAGEGEAKPGEGRKNDRRKKDAKPREPRERPAFHVGELVFGRILDINDDAVLIDLSGKGLALFDRLEEAIVDEPATPAEARAAAAEAAAEDREHATEGEALAAADAPAAEAVAPEATPAEAVSTEAAPTETVSTEAAATEVAAEAATGEAPKEEVKEAAPLPPILLEVGAHFVGYIHNDGGRGGLVVVTRHPKRASRIKPVVAQAVKDRTLVKGLVTGVIKGGLEVDVEGLRAFAPASHVDLRPGADLTPLLARRLDFYVTQYGKRGRDVVLSRKPMLESEAKASREAALAKLAVGSVVPGTVRSVVQFGAFIDLGGIEGLVPLSEMSHNRSEGPSDVFKPGQAVDVKILKVDDRGKVWLSRKATLADPWQEVAKKYATGTRHTGKVVRIQPFGAFVELEPGIDGLIHVADLSTKRIESPEEVVKVGDSLEVVVSHVDASAHRIALHPAPSGDTAGEAPQRVQLYKPVKVVVVTAESGGLGVRIKGVTGRQSRGFITAAATGTARGTELRKVFPVGTELDAKVMEMDPKRGEIKLSIKALTEQTERDAYQQYRQTVARDAKFTFADLIARKGGSQR